MHVDEFPLLRANRRPPDMFQDMTIETNVCFLGIKEYAITIESNDFERYGSV
jgi:hypothetical protein